jgi:hypothetical protein
MGSLYEQRQNNYRLKEVVYDAVVEADRFLSAFLTRSNCASCLPARS